MSAQFREVFALTDCNSDASEKKLIHTVVIVKLKCDHLSRLQSQECDVESSIVHLALFFKFISEACISCYELRLMPLYGFCCYID